MAQFFIPTIFTAIDRGMTNTTTRIGIAVSNLQTEMRTATQGALSLSGAMQAMGAAVIGAASARTLIDYDSETANLKALTGVQGRAFNQLNGDILRVASTAKTSAVDVAKTYTTIANAMPEMLSDTKGLGRITQASILLAKASRMELAPAAEATANILNQFGKGANDAARLVDMLAAGSKYGSAEIEDLSSTLREFGASARLANVSLIESVALTELVSKFRKGTQAGIELRNVMLYLDTLKVQDPKALNDLNRLGVNMDLVSNKALPLAARLIELKKVAGDDAALFHIFGKENLAMAATILQNADRLGTLVTQVGETGNAARMAAENTNNLRGNLQQLKASWDNILISTSSSNGAFRGLNFSLRLISENLGTIISVAVPLAGVWLTWKGYVIGTRIALFACSRAMLAYNFMAGLMAVKTGTVTGALLSTEAAAYGVRTALTLLNASFLTQLGVVGLVLTGVATIAQAFKSTGNSMDDLLNKLEAGKNRFAEIERPLTKAQVALAAYNDAVEKYNTHSKARQVYNFLLEKSQRTHIFNPDIFGMGRELNATYSPMPQKADFFTNPADTVQFNDPAKAVPGKSFIPDGNGGVLEIHVKADSGTTVTGIQHNNISIEPKIKSTAYGGR